MVTPKEILYMYIKLAISNKIIRHIYEVRIVYVPGPCGFPDSVEDYVAPII